ncbi:hypothetical protein [Microseira wollei]|nr:hypothetical protein [Microseira wollei]
MPLHPVDAPPIALARHLIFSATTPGLIVPCPYTRSMPSNKIRQF